MRKWLGLFFCWVSVCSVAFADSAPQKLPKQIKLNITFDWQQPNQPFNNEMIHIKKTVILQPEQSNYVVVSAETKADDKLPTTWALLLKPMDVSKQQMTAVFMLVQYGLNHNGEIIAEPKVIFNNGQAVEMLLSGDNKGIKLKVFGKWS
jgi:hypothetical protein